MPSIVFLSKCSGQVLGLWPQGAMILASVCSETRGFKMTAKRVASKIGAAIFCAFAGVAFATPGGVDARGCHTSAKIGHHCHASRAGNVGASGESSKERDRRLKRECKGRPNSGVCLGYAKP